MSNIHYDKSMNYSTYRKLVKASNAQKKATAINKLHNSTKKTKG